MILILGATGVTGALIAREAQARHLPILLAGRNRNPILGLAAELNLGPETVRTTDLNDGASLSKLLDGVEVVLNATSPASLYAYPLAAESARRGISYTDISGDVDSTLRILQELDAPSRAGGATLAPGAGFSPYCGIAALRLGLERLPGASRASLVYASPGFAPSLGTIASEPETIAGPCLWLHRAELRDDGHFGRVRRDGTRWMLTRPMLDPVLASQIPGVTECQVEMAMPPGLALATGYGSRAVRSVFKIAFIRSYVQRQLSKSRSGARPAHSETDTDNVVEATLWRGEDSVRVKLKAPPIYPGTARCAVSVAAHLLGTTKRPTGFVPPPLLFDTAAQAIQAAGLVEI